jgi:hypothetical protein
MIGGFVLIWVESVRARREILDPRSAEMKRRMLITVVAIVGLLIPLAYAEKQPHMQRALQALENARAQLEKAEHDKGGHRAKAIELINQAIVEVQAGIEYDNTHPAQPKR